MKRTRLLLAVSLLWSLPLWAENPSWAVVEPPPQVLDHATDRAAIYFYSCTDAPVHRKHPGPETHLQLRDG